MTPGERSGLSRAAPTGLVPSGGWHRPLSRPGSRPGSRTVRDGKVQRVTRFDTVSLLTDYGNADEFVGVVKRRDPRHRSARDGDRPHARDPALRRARRFAGVGALHHVRSERRRDGGHRPGRGHRSARGRDRGRRRERHHRRSRQRSAGAGGGDGWRRRARGRAHQSRVPAAAPGATFAGRDVFAPAAAHICNGVEFERARPRGRPDVAAARRPCRCHATSATGSSPRCCGSTASATANSTSGPRICRRRGPATCNCGSDRRPTRPAAWCAAPCASRASPPSAPVSRAWCSTRTACWRSASTGDRRPRSSGSSPATRCCSADARAIRSPASPRSTLGRRADGR